MSLIVSGYLLLALVVTELEANVAFDWFGLDCYMVSGYVCAMAVLEVYDASFWITALWMLACCPHTYSS
jgi:hypothetical protein